MNFLEYIKTLMPVFTKNDIVKSCELTQSSLTLHTIPAYETASTLWKGQKFKSKEVNSYVGYYTRTVGLAHNENMLSSVLSALKSGLLILNKLSSDSKNIYSEKEANVSMTYVKMMVLRIIEAAEYANTYARRYLNYMYYLETYEEDQDKGSEPSPAEIKWLKDGLNDFCLCIKVLRLDIQVIEKHLDNLPDANITELTERTFSTTIGQNKMDPLQLRFLSVRANPFYLLGMWKAQDQAERYKTAKQELELLQLRKFNLVKMQEREPDAKIQKEIEYMQNRVSGMIYDITKMEEDYAG